MDRDCVLRYAEGHSSKNPLPWLTGGSYHFGDFRGV